MDKKPINSGNNGLLEVILVDNQEISPGAHVIAFDRMWDFLPGHVVKIGVDKTIPPRIYSICSGNKEDEVRILFNVKDDGFLTPRLSGMIPGDKIFVSKPYGSFTSDGKPAWWIATGTGIAPFNCMLESGIANGKKMIHGVRQLNQFYFEVLPKSSLLLTYRLNKNQWSDLDGKSRKYAAANSREAQPRI